MVAQLCASDQYPHISMRYVTTNKRHSLEYLDSLSPSDRAMTANGILREFERLTKTRWMDLINQNKGHGGETILLRQIKFSGTDEHTGDTKIWVFRFDTHLGVGKGRILGFKDSPCSALFVIGFDFDFSAYDHGS